MKHEKMTKYNRCENNAHRYHDFADRNVTEAWSLIISAELR